MSESSSVSDREQRLERILADYLHAVEAGTALDRARLIEQHPDLAADLKSFFTNRDAMERLAGPIQQQLPDLETIGPAGPGGSGVGATIRYFGDYELLQEIARGGMGVVYRARQVSLNRLVALKMILSGQLASADDVQRFRREAEAAANLDHHNIVPIYEVGEHDGQHYFSMKLVEGSSLQNSDVSKENQRQVAELIVKVARAVHHAHQRGILHRDLKPGNILLDRNGEPLVTDFGLAKSLSGGRQPPGSGTRVADGPGSEHLTHSGAIVGTPAYMAPEQVRAEKGLTVAVDIYSLGAILYELLAGHPPFQAATPLETLLLVLDKEPATLHSIRPKIDRDLDTISLKCLHKNPRRRYESAAALADDLERWLRGEPITARPIGRGERLLKWVRRRPAAAALIAISVLAVAVLLGGTLYFNAQLREQIIRADVNAANEANERRRADREAELAWANQYAAHVNLMASDWESGNLGRILGTLTLCRQPPPGRKDLRGWEWYYQERLCHQELLSFTLEEGSALKAAFCPGGMRLVSAQNDGTMKLWDPVTGLELCTLKATLDGPSRVAFSPDGTRLAVAVDDIVYLLNADNGQQLRKLKAPEFMIACLAFSPDGMQLAAGNQSNCVLKLWNVANGEEIGTFSADGSIINDLAFSPDGTRLVSAGLDGGARLWDVTSGKELRTFKVDFDLLAAGTVTSLTSVAFSPDGKTLATSDGDGTVRLWDVATGKKLQSLSSNAGSVWTISFSPDGTLLVIGTGIGTVELWSLAGVKNGKLLRTIKAHKAFAYNVTFSPDGTRLVSTGGDGSVKLWDTGAGRDFCALKVNRDGFLDVLSGLDDVGPASVASIAFDPEGNRLAATSADTNVVIWDVTTGQELRTLKPSGVFPSVLSFSPDGTSLVVTSTKETVTVWNAATGKEQFTLNGPGLLDGWFSSLAFSPDGAKLAATCAGGGAGAITQWDMHTGKEIRTIQGKGGTLVTVAFSPDGTQLAAAGIDGKLQLWDAATGQELRMIEVIGSVTNIAFSPARKQLASASTSNLVQLWDLSSGQELLVLKGHLGHVNSVVFSADGKRLFSGSDDGTVKIWDAETGQELRTLKAHAKGVNCVAFHKSGRLASAGRNGMIRIWDGRPLTPEVKTEHAAVDLLDTLFAKPLPASAVRAAIEKQAILSDAAREKALGLLDRYHEESADVAETYSKAAWPVLRHPFANVYMVQNALAQMQAAHQWDETNTLYRLWLGIAHYRLGRFRKKNYAEALKLLDKCDEENPTTLAFLTMTRTQLGQKMEASTSLDSLRKLMKKAPWKEDWQSQRFLIEAEAVVAPPASGKVQPPRG